MRVTICSRCWTEYSDCACIGTAKVVEARDIDKPDDLVNHPPHYTQHPSGVECITITKYASFPIGNAIKYLWRVSWGKKGGPLDQLRDLEKARWYIDAEIARRTAVLEDPGKCCDKPMPTWVPTEGGRRCANCGWIYAEGE